MKTVILAGGLGTRISEESHLKPKPMIEIGEKPILWHIMKLYSYYGHNDFVICCGYKGYVIKEYFADYYLHCSDITFDFTSENKMIVHNNVAEPWKVTLVDTGLNTQTGGRIKRIKNYIGNERFMLTYGDGVSDVNITDLVDFHIKHNKIATMTAIQPGGRFGVLEIDGEAVVRNFAEKKKEDGGWVNGGFMVLEPSIFDYIDNDATIFENMPLETLAKAGQLNAFKHKKFWQLSLWRVVMTENEERKEILSSVKRYYQNHMKRDYSFKDGDKISYAGRVHDEDELCSLVDASLDFWLTSGRYAEKFERDFANFLGVKYCSLVNSGSSANLIAFMSLTSPLLKERAIKPYDEVITVAACFPTTIAPIIQYGAVPVFIDVQIPQYNIDCSMLEKALSKKTKAVMIAHTLGNPFDLRTVKEFCNKNNLWLIEDNCDALGSKYYIDGEWRYTGTIGDIGTSSFYPPHHMTMGEGGAVYTDDPILNKIINSFRDWGRDCSCPSGVDNLCNNRFNKQYGELPMGYDHKYVYSHFGYNLKATDMQAAIGCAQLGKLPVFIQKRKYNFERLKSGLKCIEDKIILPVAEESSDPSWFGFLITCKQNAYRNKTVQYLEQSNIQTRMLFAGNIIKHPCFDEMRKTGKGYRVVGDLTNTDEILNNSFWVGVYPGMNDDMIDYMVKTIKESLI